jgi:hypothetical protein
MYRKIFKVEKEEDLNVKLPDEYLHKGLEVIAFELDDYEAQYATKKRAVEEAITFFKTINVDTTGFKFNRDEANER